MIFIKISYIFSIGPIIFDSIDLINDSVIITYDKSTGDDESLEDWSIRRQNDEQPEIVYEFPSSFVIRPQQTVHILSQRSPQSEKSEDDVLIADEINSWEAGQVIVTRLVDPNDDDKASITQTRL